MADDNDFLQDLVLLNNDPGLEQRLLEKARMNNVDAQYALGLVYAEGRGTDINVVDAYAWLSQAMRNGDKDAEQLRYVVVDMMTDEQFNLAKKRATEIEYLLHNGNVH